MPFNFRRFVLSIMAACAIAVSAVALAEDSGKNTDTDSDKTAITNNFNISGYRTIRWRDFSSSGDKGTFLSSNSLQYFSSKVEQSSQIYLTGTLPKDLKVDGSFTEIPYQDRTLTLNITGKNGMAKLGDFSTTFPGDKLVSFTKTIRGFDFKYNMGALKLQTVVSKEKSKTQKISFLGQNSRGPYLLGTFSIVEGTESVFIDGKAVSKSDYSIDYFRGDITFKYNINPTETVEVYYESEMLFEIKTGSMDGVGLEYKPPKSKFTVGGSMLSSGTTGATYTVTYSNTATFTSIGPADLNIAKSLGNGLLEKYSEIVMTTTGVKLTRGVDYSMDYENGTITFFGTAFNIAQDVTVEYFYYNSKYVRKMENEELTTTGQTEFILSRSTVYSGTEDGSVKYCDEGRISCIQMYPCSVDEYSTTTGCPANTDYVIVESRNSLVVINPQRIPDGNHFIQLSYIYVQKTSPTEQKSERKMYDAYVKGNLFKDLYFEGEMAQSEADLSSKTVQVMEEYMATVTSTSGRIFYFATDQALVSGSEEIYFDDLLSYTNKKSRSNDYTLEYDSVGKRYKVTFNDQLSMPVGTTIFVNYRYTPEMAVGSSGQGNAYRAAMNYSGDRVSLKGEYTRKDPEFAPLNNYNNMEQDRLESNLNIKVTKQISAFSDLVSYNRLYDFTTGDKNTYNKLAAGLKYTGTHFPEITFTTTGSDSHDNLTTSKLDNTKRENELKLKYDPTGKKVLVFDGQFSDSRFRDSTGNISDKDMNKHHVGVTYNPSEALNLKTYYEINNVDATAPPQYGTESNYSVKTKARGLDIGYKPDDIWVISGNVLLQSKEDPRPTSNNESWDTARIAAVANRFGNISFVSVSFYKQDLPNDLTGGTRTDTFNSSFGYEFAPLWVVEPSLDVVTSEVTNSSRSKSTSPGLTFRYNPKHEGKIDGSFNYKNTRRRSETANSTATSTHENQYLTIVGYYPRTGLSFITKYDLRKTSASSKTDVYLEEVRYQVSSRLDSKLNFTRTKYSTTSGASTKDETILQTTYKLTKVFSAVVDLKHQTYNTPNSASDYSGTIFDFSLTAKF